MKIAFLVMKIFFCILSLLGISLAVRNTFRKKTSLPFYVISVISGSIFCIMLCIPFTEYSIICILIYILACIIFGILGVVIIDFIIDDYGICPCIFVIFVIILFSHHNNSKTEECITTTYEIVCVNDSFSTVGSGSAFVMHIYEEAMYKYYYKLGTENEGIKLGSVPAEETTIYYTKDSEIPHIDIIEMVCDGIVIESEYKLYVPEGSISNEYILDAQ